MAIIETASAGNHQEAYRVPLHIRNATQARTALNWEGLKVAEGLSDNDVISAWTALFAQIFAEACDSHRIHPAAFERRFSGMENMITDYVEQLKWIESDRADSDVGFAGISPRPTEAEKRLHPDTNRMQVDFRIEKDSEQVRRGVLMIVTFPELKAGQGPQICEMYFPDAEAA